jgi:membrane fusion protein, heavy metal efflux system
MIRRPLLMLALLAACGTEPPPAEPAAVPAGTVMLDQAQQATARLARDTVRLVETALPLEVAGTVATADPASAHVGSIVEGRVVRIAVLPGARVRAGQVLVVIHSHELADAQRDLAAAQAMRVAAEAAWQRSSSLLASGAVSREEVERRTAARDAAAAEVTRASELVEHLHPLGNDVTVVAPADGTVFAVHTKVGEVVLPGTTLVDVGSPSRLWVTGWVPERAVPHLGTGTRVAVRLAAFPNDTFAGRVVSTVGALDAARRALDVRVALDRVPTGLVPGMFATITLDNAERAPRALLPSEAVQRTASGTGVFVDEGGGRFRFRPVASAFALDSARVAVEGLPEGLVVVTTGAYRVRAALEALADGGGDAHAH